MKEEISELNLSEQQEILYMKRDELLQLAAKELKRIIVTVDTTPAHKRFAAVRLFELGEKDYGVNFLVRQMNLYKDPETHKNTILETCTETAKALGRLQDRRAIEPLFEALGELAYAAAYGLAKINGPDVEKRLLEISKSEEEEGLYAAMALGLMKKKSIVTRLIYILEHSKEFKEQFKGTWIGWLDFYTIRILGSYKDNQLAEAAFKKFLTKPYLPSILTSYLVQNDYPESREVEWEIVKKYGWDKYVDTDAKKFALSFRSISWWDTDYKTPCPFKTDMEIEKLREEVVENIWREMKSDELRA